MFSDRWWIFKAASALLLFGALCARSGGLMSEVHPPIEQVAVFTDDLRTKTLALTGRKVLTADAAGFDIDTRVGPVRVLTPHPPPAGTYVSMVVRPIGPRTFATSSVQFNAGWAWKRPLNYALSILVVLVYAWAIRDRFRWRIQDGVFRGKY
ncbi:MAG TPA: hypothetical protein VKW04_14330 [Planctomycetota bacterium]|nr:hypothetical protein [Planctomycetota bacterium]